MTTLIPTSSAKVFRQVQFYPEVNGPGLQVVDPQLYNAGIITSEGKSKNADTESVRIQGSRKEYANIAMGIEGTISLDYHILDTKLIRYGILDPGGVGTIEEPLAFIYARKINNVDNYKLVQGCVTDSITINIDRVPTISHTFTAVKISQWMTLAALRTALGLTGTSNPKWASPLTDEPWTHLLGTDGASSAVTLNGSAADITKMSITVNNNVLKQKPLGYKQPKWVEAGNKDISLSIEPYLYDNSFEDLVDNNTLSTIVVCLKATSPVVNLTVTGCHFKSHDDKSDSSGGEFITNPVAGSASEVSIPAYP